MRSPDNGFKTTEIARQGQVGSYLLHGELTEAREAKAGHKGPFLAMVGKCFKTHGATGQPLTVRYMTQQIAK